MYKFNDIHAKKMVRNYIIYIILGFIFLACISIPAIIGMKKVNEIYYNAILYKQYEGMDQMAIFAKVAGIETFVIFCLWTFGLVFLSLGVAGFIVTKHFIKKHGGENFVETLEIEINQPTTIWLASSKIYLTEHYVVSFRNGFCALPLKEILWTYQKRRSLNGLTTVVSLILFCSYGKKYEIAVAAPDAKNIEEEAQFIMETVFTANPDVLLGYTNENIIAAWKLKKEIKKQRKTA